MKNLYKKNFFAKVAKHVVWLSLFIVYSQAFAQGVVSIVNPSNSSPLNNETINVAIHIDMSGTNELLGSFTANLRWDASVLQYTSDSGLQGFTGVVNLDNTGNGEFGFNGVNPQGTTGDFDVIEISFLVIGTNGASTTLDLEYVAMSAALTFVDLIPSLTVEDAEVNVANSPPGMFALLEPADSAVIDTLNPTLSWETSADPDGDDVAYNVFVASDENLTISVVAAEALNETNYTITLGLERNQQYFWNVVAVDANSAETASDTSSFTTSDIATHVDRISNVAPDHFELSQNFPNPFNPETRIQFDVPHTTHVKLHIFNSLGQHVRTLLDEVMPAGTYSATWNGLTDDGSIVPSGFYVYQLKTGDFTQSRKMLFLK